MKILVETDRATYDFTAEKLWVDVTDGYLYIEDSKKNETLAGFAAGRWQSWRVGNE